MSEENTPKKKYKTIDRDLVYRLSCIQCTPDEIAEVVGVNVNTLKRRFQSIMDKGKREGQKSLRRAMWEKAMNGDTRVMLWLSKQYLGMKDQVEDTHSNLPLPWED